LTDIHIGWTECAALAIRDQSLVVEGISAVIGRLPQYRQRLMHRRIVKGLAAARLVSSTDDSTPAARAWGDIRLPDELGQDLPSFATITAPLISLLPIASFSSRRVAMLSCLAISSTPHRIRRCAVAVYVSGL
jgi:hypothetical protein